MEDTKKTKKKAVKAPKVEKKIPAKKLPKLFKKAYSEKAFKNKILKKIYIEDDKSLVTSIYSDKIKKGKTTKLIVPKNAEFTKKDVKRLKGIAKSIKANKGRVKSAPFIAVAAVIVAVGITVTVFKNVAVKYAIRTGMQSVFKAKTDIGRVKVEIFGSQIKISNLAQASSDDPMKNIFQFDTLDLDFNLTQLLRGRFDAENLEISGLALGTERKTSGALPLAKSAKNEAKSNDTAGFYKSLKEKSGNSLDSAKKSIATAFADYNPQTMVANVKENLKSPAVAKEVEADAKSIVEKWKAKPDEVEKEVEDFRTRAESLTSIKVDSLKTQAEIEAAIAKIKAALETGEKVSKDINETMKSIEGDKKSVESMKTKIEAAIKNDKNLVADQINKISDLSLDGVKNILTGALDSAGYELLGKYYPYLQKLISYASSMKGKSSSSSATDKANKQAKDNAKKARKRYVGRNVYWKADKVPTFLIEHALASGAGIKVEATNISNDMDKRGAPWVVDGSYKQEKRSHIAKLTVDSRANTKNALITGDYTGNNFPVSLDLAKMIEADGIPNFSGTTGIKAQLTANEDFSFGISGKLNLNPVKLSAAAFSPEFASKLYQNALSTIKKMDLGANVGFSQNDGVALKLTSDADKQLMNAIKTSLKSEMASIKETALAEVEKQLAESSNGVISNLDQFTDIYKTISSSDDKTAALKKALEAKSKELAKAMTKKAADKGIEKMTEKLESSEAGSAASKAASNLLKGFRK